MYFNLAKGKFVMIKNRKRNMARIVSQTQINLSLTKKKPQV